ncbi:hypothetical protein RFI_24537 [Reticulomyxa filosa]|uniref:Uncharacterized protein n=1 Tax=Reticulomyxa filosa TaxID=46433 RepID=X6MFQ3_RETFI|nr:hypothetical protein RFI_24537 [Reticulomyxa filosa]|eukprot:ETO12838.1 hypothetical protein RFI_24537 [Reticulomyxa filosa]
MTLQDIQASFSQQQWGHVPLNVDSIPSEYAYFTPNDGQKRTFQTTARREALTVWDQFGVLFRVALPQSNFQQDFIDYVQMNQTVWHIYSTTTNGNSNAPRIPYPPYIQEVQTGVSELTVLGNNFTMYVSNVVEYFVQNLSMTFNGEFPLNNTMFGLRNYGFACIDNQLDCAGDNRGYSFFLFINTLHINAIYQVARKPFNESNFNNSDINDFTLSYKLTDRDLFITAGVTHNYFNKTVYSSLAVYVETAPFTLSYIAGPNLVYTQWLNSSLHFPPNVGQVIDPDLLQYFFVVAICRPEVCEKYMNNFGNAVPMISVSTNALCNDCKWSPVERDYLCEKNLTHYKKKIERKKNFVHILTCFAVRQGRKGKKKKIVMEMYNVF